MDDNDSNSSSVESGDTSTSSSDSTPSSDQYADADSAAANSCSENPVAAPAPSCSAPKAYLAVKVTDHYEQPIRNATVTVEGLGNKTTDKHGLADYGEVVPGTYNITAQKEGYRPAPKEPVGPAKGIGVVPAGSSIVVPLYLDVFRENIVFFGSEMDYNSFWLKMMFVASAWYETSSSGELRAADRKTVAYVDVGYTRFEKLAIDYLRDKRGYNVVKLGSGSDVVQLINDRLKPNAAGVKEKYLLQDVVFFSHGLPTTIRLNYNASPYVDFSTYELPSASTDAFTPDGRIYSYACRTGVSSWSESFSSDDDAGPENSLAQKMADHFQVETHAFLRRSFYGEVLREKSDSATIAATLKMAREKQDGNLIEIPPEHQGLPHPYLDSGWFAGSKDEGTNEYALWRKAGGIRLPRSGDSPKGLSAGLRVFTPK